MDSNNDDQTHWTWLSLHSKAKIYRRRRLWKCRCGHGHSHLCITASQWSTPILQCISSVAYCQSSNANALAISSNGSCILLQTNKRPMCFISPVCASLCTIYIDFLWKKSRERIQNRHEHIYTRIEARPGERRGAKYHGKYPLNFECALTAFAAKCTQIMQTNRTRALSFVIGAATTKTKCCIEKTNKWKTQK